MQPGGAKIMLRYIPRVISTTPAPAPAEKEADTNIYPSALTTYEEVAASPELFMETLEKLHKSIGTKFIWTHVCEDRHKVYFGLAVNFHAEQEILLLLRRLELKTFLLLKLSTSLIIESGSFTPSAVVLIGSLQLISLLERFQIMVLTYVSALSKV
ncbi:hypothetical protein AAC387_Pa02g3472 [Persea americana]